MTSTSSLDQEKTEALRRLARRPINRSMVTYVATVANGVVEQMPARQQTSSHGEQRHSSLVTAGSTLPSLEAFIDHLTAKSGVGPLHLLATLVYLARLKAKTKRMRATHPCTNHRILLASLMLSVKTLEDGPPMNWHWVNYARFRTGRTTLEFGLEDVNDMERQLICVLGWNLAISEPDLWQELQPLLAFNRDESPSGQGATRKWRARKGRPVRSKRLGVAGLTHSGVLQSSDVPRWAGRSVLASMNCTSLETTAREKMACGICDGDGGIHGSCGAVLGRRGAPTQRRGLLSPARIVDRRDTSEWRNMHPQESWSLTCEAYTARYAAVEQRRRR